ncbi:RING finger domain-containing protein [Kistimonas asteriae]|uniref:RING finger domain-containing protein n=1 Tax=Kistimonas asteriae TaxID=517724 RepID=UPI001BA7B255|nr:RING finger domain-containing protein [Kistimonas asteriae]
MLITYPSSSISTAASIFPTAKSPWELPCGHKLESNQDLTLLAFTIRCPQCYVNLEIDNRLENFSIQQKKALHDRKIDIRNALIQASIRANPNWLIISWSVFEYYLENDLFYAFINRSRNEECPICRLSLENFSTAIVLSCHHSYCKNCLESWLKTPGSKKECPLCTKEIVTEELTILLPHIRHHPRNHRPRDFFQNLLAIFIQLIEQPHLIGIEPRPAIHQHLPFGDPQINRLDEIRDIFNRVLEDRWLPLRLMWNRPIILFAPALLPLPLFPIEHLLYLVQLLPALAVLNMYRLAIFDVGHELVINYQAERNQFQANNMGLADYATAVIRTVGRTFDNLVLAPMIPRLNPNNNAEINRAADVERWPINNARADAHAIIERVRNGDIEQIKHLILIFGSIVIGLIMTIAYVAQINDA